MHNKCHSKESEVNTVLKQSQKLTHNTQIEQESDNSNHFTVLCTNHGIPCNLFAVKKNNKNRGRKFSDAIWYMMVVIHVLFLDGRNSIKRNNA